MLDDGPLCALALGIALFLAEIIASDHVTKKEKKFAALLSIFFVVLLVGINKGSESLGGYSWAASTYLDTRKEKIETVDDILDHFFPPPKKISYDEILDTKYPRPDFIKMSPELYLSRTMEKIFNPEKAQKRKLKNKADGILH